MRRAGALLALLALALTSCSRTLYEAHFAPPSDLEKISEAASRAPFIKCHMPDGRVFVLERWSIEEGTGLVRGFGIEYSPNRTRVGAKRAIALRLADVALLETDRPYDVDVSTGSAVGMAIGSTASFVLSVICFANPTPCYHP